jgi:hypothetical protein
MHEAWFKEFSERGFSFCSIKFFNNSSFLFGKFHRLSFLILSLLKLKVTPNSNFSGLYAKSRHLSNRIGAMGSNNEHLDAVSDLRTHHLAKESPGLS